ncbi:MAG TPA: hypothetical protein VK783_04955 [Bacteroidia bacterium]|jgi:hypothetical protein|nr:hypothetical protein [Bacteroidia bacterium]
MYRYLFYIGVCLLFGCKNTGGEMDTYRDCGLQGDARSEKVKMLDELKNRYTFPDSTDFDRSVTIQTILAPGEDRNRFNDHKAVDITGYVYDVKVGGVETCNCHERNPQYRDTHIELVLSASSDDEKRCVIVEVTPRMREIMAKKGLDWSTDNLRNTIKGHVVRVKGWLLFDEEHVTQAENTDPDNPKDWRATCWEIHPVTSIEVLDIRS